MSGPCAHVLLPNELSAAQHEELIHYLNIASSSVEGDAFWMAGRPFFWYTGRPDEEEVADFLPDWYPKAEVVFCAGCRGAASDFCLGMLVAKVAQMFGGIIALGGHIQSFTDDPFILLLEGRYQYEDEDLLTPEFMYHWIAHPHFKMVN
jgi:hypothetical protein